MEWRTVLKDCAKVIKPLYGRSIVLITLENLKKWTLLRYGRTNVGISSYYEIFLIYSFLIMIFANLFHKITKKCFVFKCLDTVWAKYFMELLRMAVKVLHENS